MNVQRHAGPPAVRELSANYRPGLGLRKLRGRRQLVQLIVERDLKLRYAQTYLGPVWVIVQPLVPALLFTFVFTKIVKIGTAGVPYLLFVTSAMAPWNFVSRAVQRGGPALIAERSLFTRVYFPRLAGQVAVVASSLVDLLVSLVVVAVAMVQTRWHPTWRILALPVVFVWAAALALGCSTLIAALSVRRRDLVQTLPFITSAWLYLTPVAYPLASASSLRTVLLANPMTAVVESFRWTLIGRSALGGPGFILGLATTACLLVVGLLAFDRADWDLADVL